MSYGYTATKYAVVGLSKSIAAEYATHKIRFNTLRPRYILTPLLEQNIKDEMRQVIASKAHIDRLGEASEIAELVFFLSSDRTSFITVSYYIAHGRYTAV